MGGGTGAHIIVSLASSSAEWRFYREGFLVHLICARSLGSDGHRGVKTEWPPCLSAWCTREIGQLNGRPVCPPPGVLGKLGNWMAVLSVLRLVYSGNWATEWPSCLSSAWCTREIGQLNGRPVCPPPGVLGKLGNWMAVLSVLRLVYSGNCALVSTTPSFTQHTFLVRSWRVRRSVRCSLVVHFIWAPQGSWQKSILEDPGSNLGGAACCRVFFCLIQLSVVLSLPQQKERIWWGIILKIASFRLNGFKSSKIDIVPPY